MSPDDNVQHRTRHTAPGDRVSVREVDAEERDGAWFAIRMPISSTAEARDGEAFTRERLDGWREQIETGTVPVFGDHGKNDDIADARYSFAGKFGYYQNAEVVDRDGGMADLVADTVVLDPTDLPESTGAYRQHLSILKAQAEAGMPITASVGWSENTGDRDVPGDSDLLEGSIVGIPSDARADATADASTMARAVSAASDGFDVATFVRELNASERNVVTVGDEEIDLTPPEAMQNAAALAKAKKDEYADAVGDCGTGAGEDTADAVLDDSLTADGVVDMAQYLTSHEEDVDGITDPPSDWGEAEWTGRATGETDDPSCGPIQYAMWAGTATGTGLEWAQSKANDVAAAKDEDLPYPERAARNLNDPEFSEGDAVEWTSDDVIVRGRVADIGDEFKPSDELDDPITGDEGEAVYLIHELDDSLEPPQYRRENVAKPESSLDESAADLPPLDGNFADEDTNMSESESEPDAESGTDSEEAQERMSAEEFRERMVEMQEEQTEMLREMRGDGMDGDDEDEADDEDEGENAADAADSDERTVTLDGEEKAVDEALTELREEASEAEPEDPDTRDHAPESDADDGERDADSDDNEPSGFGMAEKLND